MKKHFTTTLVLIIFSVAGCLGQLPPTLNSYADSIYATDGYLYVTYTANDTGTIRAQIQLEQGTGNVTYDSVYTLSADSSYAALHITPMYSCTNYNLLFNLSNAHAYGAVINPLFSFKTDCSADIAATSPANFYVAGNGGTVELYSRDLPENTHAEIFDLTGRLVAAVSITQQIQQLQLNRANGIYLLRVVAGSQTLYVSKVALF
ncbi:MAG TPA: T9SS type A sorting domain-containing protein [Chitinophagales bacterium]|nr:T9SS type A sorting domain-containing protein [Chitinophagales bacterium]